MYLPVLVAGSGSEANESSAVIQLEGGPWINDGSRVNISGSISVLIGCDSSRVNIGDRISGMIGC